VAARIVEDPVPLARDVDVPVRARLDEGAIDRVGVLDERAQVRELGRRGGVEPTLIRRVGSAAWWPWA
jgi:hypothetical protein